jgi:predicted dehydrogenase
MAPPDPVPQSVSRRAFVQGGAAVLLTAASYERVRGANERIGVGFIGCGLIGKRHVLDFREQSDVTPVAVAETHRGRLEEAKELLPGARGHGDFRKLLDDKAVEGVVVSTPDHWHALMTMMACAAGKDVYVEKPLTLFVREGRWMIDVARRHKRVVQVGTQQRSGGHYRRARDLIAKGHLGKINSVRMGAFRNVMPGYGRPPDSDPPPEIDWEMMLGPAPAHKYNANRGIYHFRWFWDTCGGQMTNLGQHQLDIVHWCLGVKGPRSVTSAGGRFCLQDNGETPDTQDALFEYPGFTAIWSHREASRGQPASYNLEFFGPKGSLAISRRGFVVTADRKLNPADTIPRFTGPRRPSEKPAGDAAGGSLWTEAIKDDSGDQFVQFKDHVRNFLDCVKSRKQPVSDLESGHRVATACHLANLSLRLGRTLRWDADREEILGDAEAAKMLVRPYRAPWDAVLKSLEVGK